MRRVTPEGKLRRYSQIDLTGLGVESLHDVTGVGEVHHAIMDEGRRLIARPAAVGHRPRPGQPQLVHILADDLIERTVRLRIQGSPPH